MNIAAMNQVTLERLAIVGGGTVFSVLALYFLAKYLLIDSPAESERKRNLDAKRSIEIPRGSEKKRRQKSLIDSFEE